MGIWILPPKKDLTPTYGSHRYTKKQRRDKLLNIVSSKDGNAEIKLYQDVNFYVSEAKKGKVFEVELNSRDAMEIVDEKTLIIEAIEDTHFLYIEMKKSID